MNAPLDAPAAKVYRFVLLEDLPLQFKEEIAGAIRSGVVKSSIDEKTGATRIWGGDLEWYLSGRTHDIVFIE